MDMDSGEAAAIASALRRGTTRLGRRLRAERGAAALSSNKIAVLAFLHRGGPASPGAVAAAERQRPQSLTRVFAELEREGLVVRSTSGADRRAAVLGITEAGVAVLAADMAEREAWLADALLDLTPAEARLLRIAGELMERLAEDG
jgi:DNA-binding MarR family transcriptional regulator